MTETPSKAEKTTAKKSKGNVDWTDLGLRVAVIAGQSLVMGLATAAGSHLYGLMTRESSEQPQNTDNVVSLSKRASNA